jgi:hypothetical protein
MKIVICSSATFYPKLGAIKSGMEAHDHEVILPDMRDYHHLGEEELARVHGDLIREHFRRIEGAGALYVANYAKNEIPGYIGGSVLIEMGKAFDCGIPIFLMNPIPNLPYREEILAMTPIVVGENWERMQKNKL